MSDYKHQWEALNTSVAPELPVSKVVCVGRNYAAHAAELNNAVPKRPMLFIKPATALVSMQQPIVFPQSQGACHFETEIAFIIGKTAKQITPESVLEHIAGVGIALDLTLRDVQSALKEKGHPWELAKAFDGACPISPFLPIESLVEQQRDWDQLQLKMVLAGRLQQQGTAADMVTSIPQLIAFMSQHFTLQAGDIVLTGTPAGVGPLQSGQTVEASLLKNETPHLSINTTVM